MLQPDSSPILRLPCELRLQIYSHLFQSDSKPNVVYSKCPPFLPFHYVPRDRKWILPRDIAQKDNGRAENIKHLSISSQVSAVLLTCSQIYHEALSLYWSTFELILDSPIEYIPQLLQPLPAPLKAYLKMIDVSRHMIRPVDPTASARAKAWKNTCMEMSCVLPKIQEMRLVLTGDIGTITMEQGRRNVFDPLVSCGWLGYTGKLRHLTIIWEDDGWGDEGEEAVAILKRSANASMEKMGDVTRWVFEIDDCSYPPCRCVAGC